MFGERMRYYRKQKGLTQQELGEVLGFTVRNAEIRISQYETGKRFPKDELLNEIAMALDVKKEMLLLPDLSNKELVYQILLELKRLYGIGFIL